MALVPNYAKRKMSDGQLVLALGVNVLRGSAPGLIAKASGFDALFIDMEHGAISVDDASRVATASLHTGVTPIVRCARDALYEALRVLDNGGMGVVVPHIDTVEEARMIASAFRYPPNGSRSISSALPQYEFQLAFDDAFASGIAALDREILVIVMIETPEAVRNAAAIAAVDGIDMLLVGGQDLSATMGMPNNVGHPDVRKAFGSVAEASRQSGKLWGFAGVFDDGVSRDLIGLGAKFYMPITDHGSVVAGATTRAKAVRAFVRP